VSDRIVGVTGFAMHGKDTIGALLVSEYGFTKVAFADALRSMALAIDPYIMGGNIRLHHAVSNLGWDRAKLEPEVRRFLQALGTEGVRNHLGQDAWVQAAKITIDQVSGPVVITDVRFPNEADAVHGWGGELWRVNRLNADGSRFDNGIGLAHASEHHIDSLPADLFIDADSVIGLHRAVRALMGLPADPVTRLLQLAEERT
jgi:hypothetical protein